jgi:serine/threonine protein kinase
MQSGERIVIKGREYRLGSVLSTGAGSYGQVWAATDPADRVVALKFINAEAMSQADGSLHGHWRAHLEREIAFLDGLDATQSRHVVTLLAHDQVDGQPVLVLERLQANLGQWLSQLRREGTPPPDLACILDWAEQILDGLDVIHRAGFVYRDLKFSNILVGDGGALLKLADFGSLKREDGDSTRSCIGTPATMAPEQIVPIRQGANGCEYAVDFRADYYALGLLLFALLTEQSTTTAQRRLGQLLALHGQEGAGKHRDELGGLTEEERELLRRSIEFWTVPARPEQGRRGTALLLTDLLDQLLTCDPAARPASSAAIRAVLDAARADQPTLSPVLSDGLAPPPDTPPNRHPRRTHSSAPPPWLKRAVGLIGAAGLAGALAWATVIRPVLDERQVQPVNAAFAPSPQANSSTRLPPAPESTASANSVPKTVASPPQSDQPFPFDPPRTGDNVADVVVKSTEEAHPKSSAESSVGTSSESATETAAETTAAATIGIQADTATETSTETLSPATSATEPIAESAPDAPDTPTLTVAPVAPVAPDPVAPSPDSSMPTAATIPRKAIAPPAVTERSAPIRASRKTIDPKTVKASPTPVGIAEKSVRIPPPAVAEPVDAPHLVAPVSPKAPSIAKSVPKSPAPSTPAVARHSPPPKKAATAQRIGKTTIPAVRERPTPKTTAARAPAPASRTARSTPRAPALPPIQLVSNPDSAKSAPSFAQPPIELIGRATTATTDPSPRARPPIELIGRSSSPPVTASTQPAPPPSSVAVTIPTRNSSAPPKPPARSSDPITAFQKDAGRAANDIRRGAENIGNWMGRTSASVGTEIQRGLDSANRAASSWTGNCLQANGCHQSHQIERRDRWSRSSQGTVSQPQPSTRDDDEGFGNPSSRRAQEYR